MIPAGQGHFLRAVFDGASLHGGGAKTSVGVLGCAIWWPEYGRRIELVGWKCGASLDNMWGGGEGLDPDRGNLR